MRLMQKSSKKRGGVSSCPDTDNLREIRIHNVELLFSLINSQNDSKKMEEVYKTLESGSPEAIGTSIIEGNGKLGKRNYFVLSPQTISEGITRPAIKNSLFTLSKPSSSMKDLVKTGLHPPSKEGHLL